MVKFGYKIRFVDPPKLSRPLPKFQTVLPEDQMKHVREEVRAFVAKGAVRKLSPEEAQQKLGFYSKLFVVPKPGNKWRMIIDMRRLNSYIKKKSFKIFGTHGIIYPWRMYSVIVRAVISQR